MCRRHPERDGMIGQHGQSFKVLCRLTPLKRTAVMIRQLWTLSFHTRMFLRRYMPTNILLDAIRTRRGLKWGVPAMLLAVPYLLAASICTNLIDNGAPEWLHLMVLLCVWNALKFLLIGPVCLIHLMTVRTWESRSR